jgi:hypothetical protein
MPPGMQKEYMEEVQDIMHQVMLSISMTIVGIITGAMVTDITDNKKALKFQCFVCLK